MAPRPPPLSRRSDFDLAANRVADRLLGAEGREDLIDLAESNPTRCGLGWPAELLARALAGQDLGRYRPSPFGLGEARAAVASYLQGHLARVDPSQVVLTASTSEAYAYLLELLCDPGEEVLVPAPAYPLLEVLGRLASVALVRYPLRYDGTWHLDLPALEAAVTGRTRAVVVVSPSNPTGALLAPEEHAALEALCAGRGLALIGDEVFADTALGETASVASRDGCLAFHLSGLSKVCGLPQLKLSWLAVSGPPREAGRALERLAMIADAFLSVASPVQQALPALLGDRERFLAPLRQRLAANRAELARLSGDGAPFGPLRSGGGWSAVLRMGEAEDEEQVCLDLLEDGVRVHPGFFFDFERPGHLVLSLLPEPAEFARGAARVARRLRAGRRGA
ncbi:MAG TPA: pyridoxal phosphate-dependent aminotransferase [Anaeromyxobacteraceae bacterium]|nr:pyridoxal phosphate-dependent aminotransferase [Anaeromyxobacteraceae bacterium]